MLDAIAAVLLWFDVEERYNTTTGSFLNLRPKLWFDVEERYNTTFCGIF